MKRVQPFSPTAAPPSRKQGRVGFSTDTYRTNPAGLLGYPPTSPGLPWAVPTAQQLSREWPRAIDLDALDRGRVIAMTECSECHRQYWPGEYETEEWPDILEEMAQRASLSGEELESVTLYLTVASDIVRE